MIKTKPIKQLIQHPQCADTWELYDYWSQCTHTIYGVTITITCLGL